MDFGEHTLPQETDAGTAHNALMHKRYIRTFNEAERLLPQFSPFERAMLYVFSIVLAASVFSILAIINNEATVSVPATGGSLTEGIVGTPRFINPLLATSDPDRDLTQLVYSGLMRARPNNELVPDLADHYEISEDGLHYTFYLRDGLTFHDGTPVTAHDIVFTIELAQNSLYKSVKRTDWEGVVVEVVDEKTVRFTLPRAYAPFLEAATLGVLPSHLWENISPEDFPFHQLNTEPIGSGPYWVSDVHEDSSGAPNTYTLHSFKGFALGKPLLSKITIVLYANDADALEALAKEDVETLGSVSPEDVLSFLETHHVLRKNLPRVFGVFFNEGKSQALGDKAVRNALNIAVSREEIVNTALNGFGVPVDTPIPPGIFSVKKQSLFVDTMSKEERLQKASDILEDAGWKKNEETGVRQKSGAPLRVSIATGDTPELASTADAVALAWRSIGADVTVKVFSSADLNTAVIRPRDYEALLFGEVIGRSADVYAFWHSSQRNDPGLNLALYTNAKADRLLSDARRSTEPAEREETLLEFEETLSEDIPAVFLYAPEFVYVTPENLLGVSLGSLTTPAERFLNVYEWHRETERVWDIFLR